MKIYAALAQAFLDEEVDTIFSLMGDANMYWMTSLLDSGKVTNVHVRHENSAVAMADGYARSTGKVGVATMTSGPGLTQAATAIIGAKRYGVPMVLFAGDTIPGDATALQYIDHHAFAKMCDVHCEPVLTPGRALDAVQTAFHRARSLREPVILSVPMTMRHAELPFEYEYVPSSLLVAREGKTVPSNQSLDDAAGLIASSRRPVIIVGQGALAGETLRAVEELGDRIGALYATSLLAKGALADSPWSLGVAGTFSLPETEHVLRESDLVIGVGASLNKYTRQEGYLFPNARTIQIVDRPAAAMAHSLPVTCYLQGDATLTVQALAALLAEGDYENDGGRKAFKPREYDPFENNDLGTVGPEEEAMDPRDLVAAVEAAIPDGAIVVAGAGHFWSFTNKGLTGRGGRRFLCSLGFGSIGQTLPIAIGAAVGNPDLPVVMIDGDTGVLVHLLELDGAVRHRLKLLSIVMDDDAMGAELHKLRMHGETPDAALIPTPDLAKITEGLGGSGAVVRSADELAKELASYDWNTVHLIDAKMSQSIVDVTSVQANEIKRG
ncbi:Acetolactate synthase large subunit [Rhodococcus wratislaviensis]|uniref:acetolactate synthase n=1 Tax=Rhodococcus wratislaviensis TaxID=44752 RepID=A0A402CET5_RHOWR|nr:thiamine pyrophosphate-binding protein [Rhodococcus wratislaviensis]GCE42133.1 Acetolactate synthase large subunit [Rhodococcus wratislaviensis]